MQFDLTHARHNPSYCLAPGLFRSLKKGDRKKLKLDVTYTFGKNSVRFWGPEPLGAEDLRVLQGLIAMAGESALLLRGNTESKTGKQLRMKLELKWEAINETAMVAEGSLYQLAKELGYAEDGGSQLKIIRDCIERLWAVSVIVDRDGKREGYRILADYSSDEKESTVYVALNPKLAEAIIGTSPHARIEMAEVRALKTDPARLIHQRLCGWIDPGKSGKVALDTLCDYVWVGGTANASTLKSRRQRVQKALVEITSLGWILSEYAKNKWEIRRPKLAQKLR
jgi:hypothetical protein